jgi:hypothetical protein
MKTQEKIDLGRIHKEAYAAPKKPVLLDIGPATYLAISGQGEPGGPLFIQHIGALYGVAFTVKMTRKFPSQQDYVVGKLEAQWWCDGSEENFAHVPKDQWRWRLLIRTPEFVTAGELARAVEVLKKKGKTEPVEAVRLESLAEGRCVQMLHIGPYDREDETLAVMKAHAEKHGLKFQGRHHEIYLSDPRRIPPEKLKTILRHPVTR